MPLRVGGELSNVVEKSRVAIGSPAIVGNTRRPEALRPRFSAGLPLSVVGILYHSLAADNAKAKNWVVRGIELCASSQTGDGPSLDAAL